MKNVVRKKIWMSGTISAMLAVVLALGFTDALADGPKNKTSSSGISGGVGGMGMGGGPGMGMEGGMGMGPGMGPGMGMGGPGMGMGMEGGMGMGMGGGMGMGMGGGMVDPRFMNRPKKNLAQLPINEVLAIALSAQPAQKDIPEIESLLERAMAINPQVVAARAALQRAQADLERTQLEVARGVIEIRARWKVARRNVERLEAKVNKERDNAELARAYISARAELAQIHRDLPLLSGSSTITARSSLIKSLLDSGIAKNDKQAKATQQVSSPQPKVPKEFDKPVTLEFSETTVEEVALYLQETTKVQFIIDRESGITDTPVTIALKEVPLKDALQAIEDTTWPVRFVVRPYGVLVTDEDNAVTRFGQKPQASSPKVNAFGAPIRR